MAQRSKKDQIAQAALPLFLEHGIKGTSIDKVVKASGVSKPTVYNHFQDKSQLLMHVLERWMVTQATPDFQSCSQQEIVLEMGKHWLSTEACRLYGLCLGEGDRAPDAVHFFMERYDQPWRAALEQHAESLGLNNDWLQANASHRLLTMIIGGIQALR